MANYLTEKFGVSYPDAVKMIDDEVKGKLENGQNVEYWVVMDKTKIMRIKN